MDQDIKHLLGENLRLSKENNELLIKVRNVQKWAQITRILYWFIIVGVAFGAFYFIKPYLGNMLNLYTGGVSKINNISEISKTLKDNKVNMQSLLDQLNQ